MQSLWPRFVRDFAFSVIPGSILIPRPLRWRYYRALGMDVEQSAISPRVRISDRGLRIGKGSYISYDCFFDLSDEIHLGSNVLVGMNSIFVTSTHEIGTAERRGGPAKSARIEVGSGTWLGANTTVLPGVVIGQGCVIASGSVVIRDCVPNALYAGNPATFKRLLDTQDETNG